MTEYDTVMGMSEILTADMHAQRREFPKFRTSQFMDGFGEYVVCGDMTFTWFQTRRYLHHTFQIDGDGPGPTLTVVREWTNIDAMLDVCIARWTDEIRNLVSRPLDRNSYPVNRQYLKCIRAALEKQSLTLSSIGFGRDDTIWITFGFPEIDDYYVSPVVSFRGNEILSSFFSM